MASREQKHSADKASPQAKAPAPSTVEGLDLSALQQLPPGTVQRAAADPRLLTSRDVLRLQRTIGNRAVSQLLKPGPRPAVQRDAVTGNEEISTGLEKGIDSARSGGQAPDNAVRGPMEHALGVDLSGVRIHADAQADRLSRSLQARAFTTRQDIFFRQGAYAPASSQGRELLAHELTHVVQQNGPAVQRRESEPQARATVNSPGATAPIAITSTPDAQEGVIQAWPEPDVGERPSVMHTNFKCHDAVVYWVMRSLHMNDEQAIEAFNLIRRKTGKQSMFWVGTALGYSTSSTPINSPTEAQPGDIIFTYSAAMPMHSMVVLNDHQIVGYNNSGTFGTTAGDQWGTEDWTDDLKASPPRQRWWPTGGKAPMRLGAKDSSAMLAFRVAYGDAAAALTTYLNEIKDQPDVGMTMLSSLSSTEEEPSTSKSKKKRGGPCYITTACVQAMGLPDDCQELQALRSFRDGYLMHKPGGRQLVEAYYQYSPLIVEAIARQEGATAVYRDLYRVIRACATAIHEGDNEFAYRTYCAMVTKLKDEYIPDVAVPLC